MHKGDILVRGKYSSFYLLWCHVSADHRIIAIYQTKYLVIASIFKYCRKFGRIEAGFERNGIKEYCNTWILSHFLVEVLS